jgi:DNA-directed RNA polymerase specialized sigma24 family protein
MMSNIDKMMNLITRYVAKVPARYFDAAFSREDLCQQLYVAALDKSWQGAGDGEPVRIYLANALRQELRGRQSDWRDTRIGQSISIEDEEMPEAAIRYNDPPTGEPDMFDWVGQAVDQQAVIDAMPERMQAICELLQHYRLREIAVILNIHRNVLDTEMQNIRARFLAAGIVPELFLESFRNNFWKN